MKAGESTSLWKQVKLKAEQWAFDMRQLAQGMISKSPLEMLTKGFMSRELIIAKQKQPDPTDPAAPPVEVAKVDDPQTVRKVFDSTPEFNRIGEAVFTAAEADAVKELAEKAAIIETCISRDTHVLMEGGRTKPIQYIAVGEKVLSHCEFTGEVAYKKVIKTIDYEAADVSNATIDGEIPSYVISYSTTNPEWKDKWVDGLEGVLRVPPDHEMRLRPNFSRTSADKIKRGDGFFDSDNRQFFVVRVDREEDAICIRWTSGYGAIEVTAEVPIWVQGKGWTAARDIHPDDRFLTSDGSEAIVQKVREDTTYFANNLHVEDFHTYFIDSGIWVRDANVTRPTSFDQLPVRDVTLAMSDRKALTHAAELSVAAFAAGTLVHTKEGLKPIEEIRVGDWVLSYPENQPMPFRLRREDEEYEYRQVTQTFVTEDQPLSKLIVTDAYNQNETIWVTANHPIYHPFSGWTPISDIEVGDPLVRSDFAHVLVYRIFHGVKTERVYNLEVGEFHTYFVGEHGIWVHNQCEVVSTKVPSLATPTTKLEIYSKQ